MSTLRGSMGVVIWVIDWDERMIIAAFCKGLHAEPFRESLVRRQPDIVAVHAQIIHKHPGALPGCLDISILAEFSAC